MGENNDPRHGDEWGVVMLFDGGFRFAGSRVPASGSSLGVNPPSRPGGALGHVRARLLSGAARIALPAASMIVALGVGLPSEASAQSSGFNGTQATTYTLTTGANTPTFTFGPAAVIGPTVAGTNGVNGDTLSNWNVINKGQISGSGGGIPGAGIYLHTPGGNSVTNSGSITNGVYLTGNGNSSLANLAGGTITGNANITSGTMTNAGTITGTAGGGSSLTLTNSGSIGGYVYIGGIGIVTNQASGTIAGGVVFSTMANADPGTLTNAGTIGSSGGSGDNAVRFNGPGTLTNLSGGTLTGVTDGVYLFHGGTVTNQAGATITGGTDGIYARQTGLLTTVTNAGAITGTAGNGIFLQAGGSVANQAGGSITGGVYGVYMTHGSVGGSSSVTNQAGGAIIGGTYGVKISASAGAGTVTNAGSITGTSGTGLSVGAGVVNVTNLAGGTITGAIGLYANGRNVTVTNAGTITGTGGTAINLNSTNATTLILQTGSVINGDAVASTVNGRLILQGTGTANNLFTGFFFGFNVQASGIWALNNVNTFGSTATIESGALVIGDASHPGAQLTISTMTVQSGGTLGGQGTVDVLSGSGTIVVAPGGTIAPGIASPFSTLNVTGGVQFNTGSFFNVNVNGAGQTDKLALTGTGTLTGGTVQVQPAAGNYAAQTNYTILTAGTRNSTTFAGVTMNNIFLTPTLTYPSQQEVDLTLTAKPFNTAASTPNQTAVANALNAGAQNALTAILFGQTSIAGAEQIFNALSGEFYASLQNSQADQSLIAREAMLGRLRQGDASGDTAALAFGGPELSYDEALDGAVKAPAPANGGYDVTSWLQGFGGTGHVDGNGNASALGTTFSGFLTGTDARFGLLRAGLMGGYTRSNLNVNALASSGGIDSAQLGAYAGLSAGAFHLRGGGSASFDTVDATRAIAIPGFAANAHAHFNGYTAQVFGEFAYSLSINQVALEPFAGLAYARVHDAAFLESGGLAALAGSASDLGVGYSSLGLRAGTMVTLANGTVLVPHAAATWQHAFGDVTPTAALAFQSTGASFSVSGVPIAADTAVVEAGLDWRLTAQMKFGVGYQGELAKTAHTNMAKGNFTWNF